MLTAVPKSWFSCDFTVMDGTLRVGDIDMSCWREKGDKVVGALSPRGLFTRRAAIDLPETMPLSVRVFIIWLAVIIWKRDAEAQGAATAGTA